MNSCRIRRSFSYLVLRKRRAPKVAFASIFPRFCIMCSCCQCCSSGGSSSSSHASFAEAVSSNFSSTNYYSRRKRKAVCWLPVFLRWVGLLACTWKGTESQSATAFQKPKTRGIRKLFKLSKTCRTRRGTMVPFQQRPRFARPQFLLQSLIVSDSFL